MKNQFKEVFMKFVFFLCLLAVSCLPLFVFVAIYKENDKKLKKLKPCLISAVACVVANMAINFAATSEQALLAFAFYFSAYDWLVSFMFYFLLEFTDQNKEGSFSSNILLGTALFDTISMFTNFFSKHAFDVYLVSFRGETFFNHTANLFYIVHLIFIYFVAALSVIVLVRGLARAPELYRPKYVPCLVLIFAMFLGNLLYKIFDLPIDFSAMFHAFTGLCCYYLPFIITKKIFISKILKFVTQKIDFGLVVFDKDKKVLFMNDFIKRITNSDERTFLSSPAIQTWLKERDAFPHHDFSEDYIYPGRKKTYYYHVDFHQFCDNTNEFLGSYYMISDITPEIERHEREHILATRDKLTGVYNRDYFFKKVEDALDRNPSTEYCLVVTNLVNFKLVNDIYGADHGDMILTKIASELRVRAPIGNIYARINNDKFALFMPKDHFRKENFMNGPLNVLAHFDSMTYPIICQIGVYEITERNIPVSFMCDRAFLALGTIKGQYTDRIAYYDKHLREVAIHQQQLMNELPFAIRRNELFMYLQPQFNAQGAILGAEALVRWHHPEKGEILPSDFITAIEKNGMVNKVDQYIWRKACERISEWKKQGINNLYISVNISPKDFFLVDIYETFTSLVREFSIPPSRLNLEITETAIMQDFENQTILIDKLRDFGFAIEIDDFGSGYSSLNMLKDINADVLKVDMAFLQESKHNDKSMIILEKIISLSKELGMKVVTEGVESKEQVDFLDKVGCDIFQGYYFSRPISVYDFEKTYLKH